MNNLSKKRKRAITDLCSLLDYSRQAYYQQKAVIEQKALQDELIVQEVLGIRPAKKGRYPKATAHAPAIPVIA